MSERQAHSTEKGVSKVSERRLSEALGDGNSDVEICVSRVLKSAGVGGIAVREFFNHPDLKPYSYEDIEEAFTDFRLKRQAAIGGVCNRFYWIFTE